MVTASGEFFVSLLRNQAKHACRTRRRGLFQEPIALSGQGEMLGLGERTHKPTGGSLSDDSNQ